MKLVLFFLLLSANSLLACEEEAYPVLVDIRDADVKKALSALHRDCTTDNKSIDVKNRELLLSTIKDTTIDFSQYEELELIEESL